MTNKKPFHVIQKIYETATSEFFSYMQSDTPWSIKFKVWSL